MELLDELYIINYFTYHTDYSQRGDIGQDDWNKIKRK
jgi:hypothetical protein